MSPVSVGLDFNRLFRFSHSLTILRSCKETEKIYILKIFSVRYWNKAFLLKLGKYFLIQNSEFAKILYLWPLKRNSVNTTFTELQSKNSHVHGCCIFLACALGCFCFLSDSFTPSIIFVNQNSITGLYLFILRKIFSALHYYIFMTHTSFHLFASLS